MELRKPDPPAEGEKFRVLLAEDDFDIAKMLLDTLQRAHFECYYATDGALAMEAFAIKDPHLVILDVMMPKMNGWDVCTNIREFSSIPILLLTALDSADDQMHGLKIGADGYIAKPFNPTLVVANVISQLRRVYRYDFTQNGNSIEAREANREEDKDEEIPEDWIQCEACDYMGPREQFEYEDALGRMSVRCPKCKNRDFVVFSLG